MKRTYVGLSVSVLLAASGCSSSSTNSGNGGAVDAGVRDSATVDATSAVDSATGGETDSGAIGAQDGASGVACALGCAPSLTCYNGECVGLIDFETIPGTVPSDGLTINTQFQAGYGVTFSIEPTDGGAARSPVLAEVGPPATAFVYGGTIDGGVYLDGGYEDDTCAPGQNCGMFFLTDDGIIDAPPYILIVTYTSPVHAAYGEILDVDGLDGWTVDSRDATGNVIDSVVLNAGDPGTGDGIATPFSFSHASADIFSLRLRFTGTLYNGGAGLAFDNFSPASSTPPPLK